jgi:hypothetical protein
MKGLLKFLLLGVLVFGVSSVMASGHVHKVEFSKAYSHELQPALAVHSFDVVIERFDTEVLVIRNENDAVADVSKKVTPNANAPPARYRWRS